MKHILFQLKRICPQKTPNYLTWKALDLRSFCCIYICWKCLKVSFIFMGAAGTFFRTWIQKSHAALLGQAPWHQNVKMPLQKQQEQAGIMLVWVKFSDISWEQSGKGWTAAVSARTSPLCNLFQFPTFFVLAPVFWKLHGCKYFQTKW